MNPVVANIQWIMLVCGILTCTMVLAALAPRTALRMMFGESLEGPLAGVIVRNWGALITLTGAMLIYGAFDPPTRPLILVAAGASKLTFSALVLGPGRSYLRKAAFTVAIDLVMVAVFATYLLSR